MNYIFYVLLAFSRNQIKTVECAIDGVCLSLSLIELTDFMSRTIFTKIHSEWMQNIWLRILFIPNRFYPIEIIYLPDSDSQFTRRSVWYVLDFFLSVYVCCIITSKGYRIVFHVLLDITRRTKQNELSAKKTLVPISYFIFHINKFGMILFRFFLLYLYLLNIHIRSTSSLRWGTVWQLGWWKKSVWNAI